mgnify:CR=1 FL=1
MTYKIIGDSCLDLTEDMKKDPRFQMIPLTLQVGRSSWRERRLLSLSVRHV